MKVVRVLRKQLSSVAVVNAVLIGLPVIFLLVMGYHRRWVAEDAFISLRAVDNLLAGYGPVFNIGERVEVYTHPLWVAILTLWGAAGPRLEYGAVVLGLLLSGIGLVAAQAGALRLSRSLEIEPPGRGRAIYLPVGAIVFAAIPVVWDFVTSGLETGLSFAWLGVAFWLLVRRVTAGNHARPAMLEAAFIGLGPLVRPDLGIFAVGFLIVLLACDLMGKTRRTTLIHGAWILAGFALVPGLYQVFRMGYFGAIVPNTALAKEAALSDWQQGLRYLQDFSGTYQLWFPLALLGLWWAVVLAKAVRKRNLTALAWAVPVATATLHALYIIRLGGDFMHGRFLLPTLFAVLLPLAAVPLRIPERGHIRTLAAPVIVAPLLVWAVMCATSYRWSANPVIDNPTISDERAFYVEATGNPHPVTIEDYRDLRSGWATHGFELRELAGERPRILIMQEGTFPLAGHVQSDVGLVVVVGNIGVRGYAAGSEVYMVDLQGLGDPLASRMRIQERTRPGHEKQMPGVWFQARFGDVSAIPPSPQLDAALDVLHCGDVTRLLQAVEAPLTLRRFASNIRDSWELTQLRIDADPEVARDRLCGG